MAKQPRKKKAFVPTTRPHSRPMRGLDDMPLARKVARKKLSTRIQETYKKETLSNHLKETKGDHNLIIDIGTGIMTGAMAHFVSGKVIPTDEGFNSYEKSAVYKEESRIGSDMGAIYKKFLKITLGDKTSTQMKIAKDLYKVNNWPAFNSKSTKYWENFQTGSDLAFESLYAQAGEMRQGVWFPDNHGPGNGHPSDWRDKAMYQMWSGRMLTRMAMYFEIRQYLMTDEDRTWLDQTDNMSADKFYAIDYIEDTITIANGMKFSPVDVKIYLCKCKSRTNYSPAALWFRPDGSNTTPNLMRNDYVYDSASVASNLPSSAFSGLQPVNHYADAFVHIGSTPFYSSMFRNHWEVEDVIKTEILPTDKFELNVKRHLKEATSIRELEQEVDMNDGGGYAEWCEGDYSLLITFKGKPAFMRYQGTLSTGEEGLRETDVSPSKILVTSHSSFGIASNNLINSDSTPGTSKQTSNYITGEGRVLDTTLKTLDFGNADWLPEVITNVSVSEGGER